MRTAAPTIAGTGLFALDIVLRLDGSAAPPRLGGSAGNVLAILGALGWSSTPVGLLGSDSAADAICRDFARIGADTRWLLRSSDHATPVIFQHQLDTARDRSGATHSFTFACPACGTRRRPQWGDEAAISRGDALLPTPRVFYLDRPTPLGVDLAERYAREGAVVVFEPSATGDDVGLFARALRAARIVKYADERLSDLSVFDLHPGAVEIQTRGADGLRFRVLTDRPEWTHLSAYRLPAVHDTAGAGDWCTAGLLYELFSRPVAPNWMDTQSLARGLAFGQVLAALNCMTEGARGLLAAWAPDRIVDAAQRLSAARNPAQEEALPLHDAQLRDIADDVSRSGRSSTSYDDGFYCCTAS